jgi:signal transduction histidine kinase
MLITFFYTFIAQMGVIVSGNFNRTQIFISSSGIWLGFTIAMVAGYFFEKTNRKLFVQQSIIEQQREELVNERNKLKESLENLKSAQAQLIHSEKMASLGELTAGIAHEIQNPLNFVNNFAEVSIELSQEMSNHLAKNRAEDAVVCSSHISQNLEKIVFHGKRADSIVKNMLQHSGKSSTQKEPINLNALVNEYLRLSYHGLRAKDKSFNSIIRSDFDPSIDNVKVLRQDIGRVLLNIFNNAFYSVMEKGKHTNGAFEPLVNVRTVKSGNAVKIVIRDNGMGISKKTLDKIFQPFFTTKPPGEGTGLGLSISFDIITKVHGGNINVFSEEGEFAEFEISLPVSSS